MSYTKNSQNIYRSRYLFKQRLALLTALISIAFLAIVGRFFYLQIFKYDSGISSPYADTFMNASDVYSGNDSNIGGFNQDLTFRLYMKTSLGSVWQSLK